jgi:hypothetical protein
LQLGLNTAAAVSGSHALLVFDEGVAEIAAGGNADLDGRGSMNIGSHRNMPPVVAYGRLTGATVSRLFLQHKTCSVPYAIIVA